MVKRITEDDVELMCIEMLEAQGYSYLYGPTIAPDGDAPERAKYSEVILQNRLKRKLQDLNSGLPPSAIEEAYKKIIAFSAPELLAANEEFHNLLTNGIEVEFQVDSETRGDKVWAIDFDDISKNEFIVCNQFTVIEDNNNKRPDLILFVNGLPLGVIELKNPGDKNATVKKAYTQLQNYKKAIPTLFQYNALLVASDGLDAKAGSLSAGFSRFMQWKTRDGQIEDSATTPQIETLIHGMLRPDILLDLVRSFTVFVKDKKEDQTTGQVRIETSKIIAAYHQYHAVTKAVKSAMEASSGDGQGKGGVVWHTQGSGKSLSMVFFSGKLVQALDNPTIVIITDRNDLDDQLFETFAASKQLLRQEPIQIESRDSLRSDLKRAAGGILFTTIQKFSPNDGETIFPLLSDRKNIVVIADEAHRSQYGFQAKTVYLTDKDGKQVGTKTAYGFAKYMRDALPNATYLGFTGTPIEAADVNTPAVFGNYIDVYDIEQAVADGATVPIYYESRLVKIHIADEALAEIDDELEEISENAEEYQVEQSKAKWTKIAAIVGSPDRIKTVAEDIVKHIEHRNAALDGKGMIVTMNRRIAVDLYDAIVRLRPKWHDPDKKKGVVKVIMTSSSSDPESWQAHKTTKQERRDLANRVKDVNDPLKLVIVRDMWLTGFDAPCLHTLYIDKPMRGHNLMQAIARVNRVYGDKPGGLIVDYIGIASDLKKALNTYANSGGKGNPTNDISEALTVLKEKLEVVSQLFQGFDYEHYFLAQTRDRLQIILEAQEHILGVQDGKNRFVKEVTALSKAYALCASMEEVNEHKDTIAFFQTIKARLSKFEPKGSGKSDEEIETVIKQIIDKAVVSEGVVDIFDAAGIKKPDISILSDDFLEEIKDMEHKNLAMELLKKLLNDEIKVRSKKNLVQSRALSEMLDEAIKRYQNNLLTASEVIQELIKLAKDIKEADRQGQELGLNDDEYAFYSALEVNDSAKKVLGDQQLRDLARVLVERVRQNTSIDWKIKENVRAKLRVIVKRILRKYGYPPDLEKMAVERIMQQTELTADFWTQAQDSNA
ncbi:MAG: type I restriction endonuclease subunit R [Bdellovibrionales bacterium]|nr:type I restriction endonuclease subunit R [Bdellovibrionales bacterium]